jgi:predicted nucleic acid-binding Zn ribbon protein
MFKKRKHSQKHKFCPVCGIELKVEDGFCLKCGYSFHERSKKSKSRGIKWRNVIIVLIILALIYVGIQYSTGQPIIPSFVTDFIPGLGNSTNSTLR